MLVFQSCLSHRARRMEAKTSQRVIQKSAGDEEHASDHNRNFDLKPARFLGLRGFPGGDLSFSAPNGCKTGLLGGLGLLRVLDVFGSLQSAEEEPRDRASYQEVDTAIGRQTSGSQSEIPGPHRINF